VAEQITGLPQRAGELSEGPSELKIHLSFPLLREECCTYGLGCAQAEILVCTHGRPPKKRHGMPCSTAHAEKGEWEGHDEREE
jgi:hypothetical protein